MIQISSRATASNCTSVNTSNNKLDQIAEVGFVLAAECLRDHVTILEVTTSN